MNCDIGIKNRVKRAHGQMQGIINMMDNNASCEALVNQLKAVRSSVDKVIDLLTTTHLIETIEKEHNIKLENIHDALKLMINKR